MNYQKSLLQLGKFLSAGTVAIAVTTVIPESAQAFGFTRVIAFGDSLSDDGNLFRVSGGLAPRPPYVEGRFSNGPMWVEYLAQDLKLPLVNYAFGGATSGTYNTIYNLIPEPVRPLVPPLLGLQQEINTFTALTPAADPAALFTVWAGANDYLGGGVTNPQQTVTNITQAVQALINVGAKNILVPNLPDLGRLPGPRSGPNSQPLTQLSTAHNTLLAGSLALLKSNSAPDVNLQLLDVYSLVNQALNNPTSLGFTSTDSCVTPPPLLAPPPYTICSNQDQYLVWDDIHPTTAAHRQIANLALSTVQPEAVPEPTTIAGLAISGLLMGAMKGAKRCRSKSKPSQDKAA